MSSIRSSSRRPRHPGRILLTLAALAGLLALAACSGGGSSSTASGGSKVTLTFWSWVPGISQSVDFWNKSHPDIQVKLDETTSGGAGTYAKMYSALQAGNAPDLGQVEYSVLPNFEHVGGLVDLSKYGAGRFQKDFVPWTWGQVTQAGAVYAIPQDTGPMGLFYRTDLFKKYGLTVPTTWAQYLSDAKKVHAAHPNVYITAFPSNDAAWFSGLAWQAGASWFTTSGDTWVAGIDDPASQQVASYWQQLISDHLVKIDQDFTAGWYKDLSDGTLLTWPTAVWGENTLITNAASTKGDWRVAAMPNWTSTPSNGNWGGSTTVVFKDTKDPAQAAQFAEWLNTSQPSITGLITQGGLYPADVGSLISVIPLVIAFLSLQCFWRSGLAAGSITL